MITNLQKSKFAKDNNSKKEDKKKSPGNVLVIRCQLVKFEAPSLNTFLDILFTNFQSPTSRQRAIIKRK